MGGFRCAGMDSFTRLSVCRPSAEIRLRPLARGSTWGSGHAVAPGQFSLFFRFVDCRRMRLPEPKVEAVPHCDVEPHVSHLFGGLALREIGDEEEPQRSPKKFEANL